MKYSSAMFELSQLRCFVAVAEELHFGRAAERLCMTQSPLSRQILLLEHHVGTQLLDRSNRMVRLTAAGAAFLPEAIRMLRSADDAAIMARRVAMGEHGTLSIGFTSAFGYALLPEIVRRLRLRCPGIALSLKEMISISQMDALSAGELDMGLIIPMKIFGEIESVPLVHEPFLLAIPVHEAEQWPAKPTLACLHQRPFIMYSPYESKPLYQLLCNRFEEAGVEPEIVEHISQVHTMMGLVNAGIGAALVPESCSTAQFKGVEFRKVDMEPLAMMCAYRRDNNNPALHIFKSEILPGFSL